MVLQVTAAQGYHLGARVNPLQLQAHVKKFALREFSNIEYFQRMCHMNASPQSLLVMVLTTPLLAIVDFRRQALSLLPIIL
jgi:hypothetical protein